MNKYLLRVKRIVPLLMAGIVVALFAISIPISFAQGDSDGDGIPDASDACPTRGNEGGLGVDEAGCPYYDTDSDGVYDRHDACPRRGNEYGFGVGGDGCPLTSAPATDTPDATEEADSDPSSTEVPDDPNNPNDPSGGTDDPNESGDPTEEPTTTEEVSPPIRDDGGDADRDGIPNDQDSCPWRGNEGGLGVDEFGCPYYDTDWDGFFDRDDTCPTRGNEGGLGVDEVGCPYYDADWDGFFDRDDMCPWRADEYGFGVDLVGCPCEDEGCGDSDNDGVPDKEDQCPGFDDKIDVDNDGIPDDCDPLIDSDNDGVADDLDLCPGFDDSIDVDADGIPDDCDPLVDNDNDGVANDLDECPGFDDNIDIDNDSIPDDCDPLIDQDNDGVADDDDCEPNNPDVYPGAVEITGNGIDENCDGFDVALGSGDIQVTIIWTGQTDLDLAVAEPGGEVTFHGNRVSNSNGELDFDDAPFCFQPAERNIENIFWPIEQAPDGSYSVYVSVFLLCDDIVPTWELIVRVDGEIVLNVTSNASSAEYSFSYP